MGFTEHMSVGPGAALSVGGKHIVLSNVAIAILRVIGAAQVDAALVPVDGNPGA